MNNYKYIYEFDVKIEKDVNKVEKKEEGGAVTTIETKVKEFVPVFFAFKKPSRAEREDAEEYRAKKWGEFVKKGIMPEAILLKSYANYGGILDEAQKKYYIKVRADYAETLEKMQLAKINKDEDKAIQLMAESLGLRDEIVEFERNQSSFFENTAEAKSRNKLIEYLILKLTYFKEKSGEEYKQYFKGEEVDDKLKFLENLEDSKDEIILKVWSQLLFISSLYVSLGGDLKKEDVEEFVGKEQPASVDVKST